MVEFEFNVLGQVAFSRGMNSYAQNVQDWRQVFEEIYDNFADIEKKIFQRRGFPNRWTKLSPSYAAWKRVHYPGKPIMQLTGALLASLTGRGQATAQNTIKIIEKLRAEFGTDLPYAHAHQHGFPARNLPARPIVQLRPSDMDTWAEMIHEFAYRQAVRDIP
jgi:phage gpG-like protein